MNSSKTLIWAVRLPVHFVSYEIKQVCLVYIYVGHDLLENKGIIFFWETKWIMKRYKSNFEYKRGKSEQLLQEKVEVKKSKNYYKRSKVLFSMNVMLSHIYSPSNSVLWIWSGMDDIIFLFKMFNFLTNTTLFNIFFS